MLSFIRQIGSQNTSDDSLSYFIWRLFRKFWNKIWCCSDIYLTPFWWIKDSAYLLYNIYNWQIHPLLNLLHIQNEKYTKVLTLDFTNLYTKYPTKPPVSTPEYTASTMIQVLLPLQSTILVISRYFSMWCHHKRIWED